MSHFKSLAGILSLAAAVACSGPNERTPETFEPVGEVHEEFSARGPDRVVPIRILQWKQSLANPDYVTLDQITRSVNSANQVYRDAGVQFYVKLFEAYESNFGTVPAAGFYDIWVPPDTEPPSVDYGPWTFTWPVVKGSLMAAFPDMPGNAYQDIAEARIDFWPLIAASTEYANPEELLIQVMANTPGGCWSSFPFNGKGIVLLGGCFNEHTFPHEIGHFLGLPHTFSAWGGAPDPETGGVTVLEDSWDLIHATAGGGIPPGTFASKSQALAFTGSKFLNNEWLSYDPADPVDNCMLEPA